ncbi:hypothetical protein IW261DRAFT_1575364 [Armillaria novae-zelandiae]|uniref:Ribonuclease H1 N-terminal domain-containing protein n=1 Tax=Armillaria novae-zelandiae TaxID=153914 RepID=A0AA39ND53_9AGAR|nr:hypothetical protein IW261DRAFT_1576033 [Armillaria novae-zelandiae]KAK0464087.1 hypothetical protein IW261DRAFT_1575364 [Armillaria novae-zelandiae]
MSSAHHQKSLLPKILQLHKLLSAMTSFTPDQLAAAMAVLGIGANSAGSAVQDAHNNQSSGVVAGPLHSFYCFNCAYPNVIALNAIPTLFAVPKCQNNPAPAQRTSSGPPPVTSAAVNAPSAGPPATTVNVGPAVPANTPHTNTPIQNTQSVATAPVAGPSFQATVGPDGPWYAITKGRAVGVYRGWSNVTHLVTGVGRACYFCYPTHAAALTAFNEAVQAGVVEIL